MSRRLSLSSLFHPGLSLRRERKMRVSISRKLQMEFDVNIFHRTGFHLDELSPTPYAKDVKVPTLVARVREDTMTYPGDVQAIHDNIGAEEKELFWIEGTTRRFDGYNYFGEHPEQMLRWFKKYVF
ncbi:hypothetical protein BJX63DRAFT_48580 [Aspergillus granulosus]|uniref:Uncharacterized protein n=1 Tax=Aspergillus granulosus TaxID=176169 RepID=A0ABR4HTY7_9EURO